ncbi:MAG: gamma carbonic anhydrase family protein [Hyphomicrobiaceae bacterium]
MALYELDGVGVTVPEDGRYWVAPDASVIGKVRLQRDSSVWFQATLRGDNELIDVGERTNIQDGCVLHTDMGFPLTLGAGCTVGHMAMLHGCTIGEGSLIGMGATVLNGVVIGANCVIGAQALIPEGKTIPDRSLVVGAPGRVVRELSDEDVAHFARLADHYVENSRRFQNGLRPQVV